MNYKEWWNSLSELQKIITEIFLEGIFINIDENFPKEEASKIANWILACDLDIIQIERDNIIKEYLNRCDTILKKLEKEIAQNNFLKDKKNLLVYLRNLYSRDIEVKTALLGVIINYSNDILSLIEKGRKYFKGTLINHEEDIEKLKREWRKLEALIKLHEYQDKIDIEALTNIKIEEKGCPNLDCQYINPEGEKYCQKCKTSLMGECPNCYNEIPLIWDYCRICGEKDLKEWKIFWKFLVTSKIAYKKGYIQKALAFLKQISHKYQNHPDVISLKNKINKNNMKEEVEVEEISAIKEEIDKRSENLRKKWIKKIKEILQEPIPNFVLIDKALEMIPSYIYNDELRNLEKEVKKRQKEIVEEGRKRKKKIILKEIEILKEEERYDLALEEINKLPLNLQQDDKILKTKQEIEKLNILYQKKLMLLKTPDWIISSNFQKEYSLKNNLPLIKEINLDKNIIIYFILIPPGTYEMGSNEGYENEKPLHKVIISKPFYVAVTPITQKQWEIIMKRNPSYFKGENLPVEQVSWDECCLYLMALTKKYKEIFRLPTEAEWEYFCRAGTKTRYFFGDDINELQNYAWYNKNSKGSTQPVALKLPNPWGLFDIHGNVWEWCQDCYSENYYHSSPSKDPMGPLGGRNAPRVYRGGAWNSTPLDLRVSTRSGTSSSKKDYTIGFRPVITIK